MIIYDKNKNNSYEFVCRRKLKKLKRKNTLKNFGKYEYYFTSLFSNKTTIMKIMNKSCNIRYIVCNDKIKIQGKRIMFNYYPSKVKNNIIANIIELLTPKNNKTVDPTLYAMFRDNSEYMKWKLKND